MQHAISLEKAIEMTTRYRAHKDEIINPAFAGSLVLPLAETFDRAAFDRLLAQRGCTALRLYFAMNEEQQICVVIVGVDEKNRDLLPPDSALADGSVVEDGKLCPPNCGPESPLNG